MRNSPARAHMQSHVAAARAEADNGAIADRAMATGYELMLAQLYEHKRRLKEIQSLEKKADLKRQYLPAYADYVAGALDADGGGQDDVLMTIMVWRIDTGDYAGAIAIARYAVAHGLVMPDQYQRNTATLIAEEIAEAALKAHAAGQPFDFDIIAAAGFMTDAADMPDEVRAKLQKAGGYLLSAPDDADLGALRAAADLWTRAIALHPRVGVKKDLEKLDRRIKAAEQEQAGTGQGDTPPTGTD